MAIRWTRTGGLILAAACATVPETAAGGGCSSATGRLADTLYVVETLSDASPPVPLRADLAPYPPDGDGEYRVWFGDQHYIASGMPIRVSTGPTTRSMLVRVGAAGAIPVYQHADDAVQGAGAKRILAPITYDCVFLPYGLPERWNGRPPSS